MDPTVRKRSRDPHPMNCIKTKSMKKTMIENTKTVPYPTTQEPNLKVNIISPGEENSKSENMTQSDTNIFNNDIDEINNCDLTVSDSETDLEDGVLNTKKSDRNMGNSDIDADNSQVEKMVEPHDMSNNDLNSGKKKVKNVVINTEAYTVLEYVPECTTHREHKYPEYHPTRKNEEQKVPSVPTHQVLYDLWKIVRNCDQYIGDPMEKAMLPAGYLKPRY